MTIASTPVPLSEAKARLSELARRVRLQHERITLTRNGEAEAGLVSVEDLEGLEMTLEILGDADASARIAETLAALGRGEPGADLATRPQDPSRRRPTRGGWGVRGGRGGGRPLRGGQAGIRPAGRLPRRPPRHLPDRVPDRGAHPHRARPRHRPPLRHLPPPAPVRAVRRKGPMPAGQFGGQNAARQCSPVLPWAGSSYLS